MRRAWAVPVIGAALTGVLSSGVTALYLRTTMPETFAMPGEQQITAEQRHLAEFLVAPAKPFRPVHGKPVDAAALGAERGWTRAWRAPDGQTVDAFVLEFADATGARNYARSLGRAATLLTRPRAFTVDGVPGSSGLADTVADRNGRYSTVVSMSDGPRAVLLVLATKPSEATAADLARRQWAALHA